MSLLGDPARPVRLHSITVALALLALAAPRAVLAAPPNDNLANAAVISGLPYSDAVDVTDATVETPFEPLPCMDVTQSVWYSFTPGSNVVINVSAQGGPGSVNVNAYQQFGPGFGGLGFLSCNSGSLTMSAQAGQTYFFQVEPVFGTTGIVTFQASVAPPPANDSFAQAMPVTALPFQLQEDLIAATTEPGEPTPSCGQPPQATVWFAFTPSTSGSYAVSLNTPSPEIGIYTGSALGSLVQVACSTSFSLLTFHADAGTTYYLQIGTAASQGSSAFVFLEAIPPPSVQFGFNPFDPSIFDTITFSPFAFDPVGAGFGPDHWSFGDGTTAIGPPGGCCPYTTHKYAADGDYTVTLVSTTLDGRSGSATQVVHVRTHDVGISKLIVPQSARVGQTRAISVGVSNSRYPETVRVDLYKNATFGFQPPVGSLTLPVPAAGANKTTTFDINYTFTADDGAAGKVTFEAVATIIGARDAIPSNNQVNSLATKVSK